MTRQERFDMFLASALCGAATVVETNAKDDVENAVRVARRALEASDKFADEQADDELTLAARKEIR